MKKSKFTYLKSGVNINAADNFVKFISNISTKNKGNKKFKNIGGFGSISDIPKSYKRPKIKNATASEITVDTIYIILNQNLSFCMKLFLKVQKTPQGSLL